eukprot:1331534-Rhodomonas_salina.1
MSLLINVALMSLLIIVTLMRHSRTQPRTLTRFHPCMLDPSSPPSLPPFRLKVRREGGEEGG